MTGYPDADLGLKLELQLGDLGWTDMGDRPWPDAPAAQATLSWGQSATSQQPASWSLPVTLDNSDEYLTLGNLASPWYGLVDVGTPARLSVAGDPYLRAEDGGRASAPDSAALHGAGDIDVRADCEVSDWTGIIAGKNPSWQLQFDGNGLLSFAWGDGTSVWVATCPVQPQPGRCVLRAVLDVSAGTVTFYRAAAGGIDGSTWAQLGDPVDAGSGATSVTTTGSLTVPGGTPGSYYEARLLIGGATVANPSFASQAPGAGSFTDGHSNTWTISAPAEITGREYLAHGSVAALMPSTSSSGGSASVRTAIGGPLRYLMQGDQPPLFSPMHRAISTRTGTLAPHAYWTGEDGPNATSLASALAGKPPMQFDGFPQLAADGSFPGSVAVPVLNGSRWTGAVHPYSSNGSIVFRLLMHPGAAGVNGGVVVRAVTTGTVTGLVMHWYTGGALGIAGYKADGTTVFDTGALAYAADLPGGTIQQPLWISLELVPSSGNITYALVALPPGQDSGAGNVLGSYVGDVTQLDFGVGQVRRVYVDPAGKFTDWSAGHISVQSDWESLFDEPIWRPFNAWSNEPAGDRFARLCAENGVPARVIGARSATQAMGRQQVASLMSLLQECQATDCGIILEPHGSAALTYRTCAAMLNQDPAVTLDVSAGELPGASPPQPSTDDQGLVTDYTATAPSGSSARVVSEDWASSPYLSSGTVNAYSAGGLADVAGTQVARGTARPRYPALSADLGLLSTAQAAAAARVRAGDVVETVSIPATTDGAASTRQLVTGGTVTLGPGRRADWSAVPASAYDTVIMDDDDAGRVDADAAVLFADITGAATVVTVDAGFPRLSEDPADYPVDVALGIGGEQVTVTAVTTSRQPGLGTRFGAWLDQASLGASDWSTAVTAWTALMTAAGVSVPLSCARWYKGSLDYTITTSMNQMVAAGTRILLSLKPTVFPASSADRTAIAAMLDTLKAAGADVQVTLWHEPYLNGISAANYVSLMQFHGPTIRARYPLWCVFSQNDTIESNGYFPGPAWVDGIAADCYAANTTDLDNCMILADKYQLPLGLWEFNCAYDLGISPSPVTGVTQAQGAAFLTYVKNVFTQRARLGLPCGDLSLFSGTGPTTGTINALGSWASQNGGFEGGGKGNWLAGNLCTVALSTAWAQSGSDSLAITCTGGGTATAISCSSANVPTQGIAITAGQQLLATTVTHAATTPRNTRISAQFYNGSTSLSTVDGTLIADTTTGGTLVSVQATAPATTTNARLVVSVGSPAAGEVHSFDEPQYSVLPSSVDHTAPAQFPDDWRLPYYAAIAAAVDHAGGPQDMTVTRGTPSRAWPAGTPVRLWRPPKLAPV